MQKDEQHGGLTGVSDELTDGLADLKARIFHLLDIYPYLARSMIQTGLGPAMPPRIWDPVLQSLVEGGEVVMINHHTQSPAGRSQVKNVYFLPKYPWPPVSSEQLASAVDQARLDGESQ